MSNFHQQNQRGDTLVEVLIAITVMGIIVAGCMSIMNRSLVSIMHSSERTAVRAEVNSQTEMLNYVRAKDDATWQKIKAVAFAKSDISKASTQCTLNAGANPTTPTKGSFYLDGGGISSGSSSPVALKTNLTVAANGKNETSRAIASKGIWIDAVYYPKMADGSNNVAYYDFYIKACWTPLGNNPPSQTLTIVRIYDNN